MPTSSVWLAQACSAGFQWGDSTSSCCNCLWTGHCSLCLLMIHTPIPCIMGRAYLCYLRLWFLPKDQVTLVLPAFSGFLCTLWVFQYFVCFTCKHIPLWLSGFLICNLLLSILKYFDKLFFIPSNSCGASHHVLFFIKPSYAFCITAYCLYVGWHLTKPVT